MAEKGVLEWLEFNFDAETTRRQYYSGIRRFVGHVFEVPFRDIEDVDRYVDEYLSRERDYSNDLRRFIQSAKQELSGGTVKNYVTGVKQYFRENWNMEPENWDVIRRRDMPSADPVTRDKPPSREEYRRILNHLPIQMSSLALFMSSSGTRLGEALQVEFDQIVNGMERDPSRFVLRAEQTKSKHRRWVFFSDEASEAIEDWLRTRAGRTKRTPKEPKGAVVFDPDPDQSYDTNLVWDFSDQQARAIWNRALERTGLDEVDTQTNTPTHVRHIHTLRKYFRTNLALSQDIREVLMGHGGSLERSYRRYDPNGELAEMYKDAMESVSPYVPQDLDSMRAEMEEKVQQESRRSEIRSLENTLRALEGVTDDQIEEAKQNYMAARYAEELGYESAFVLENPEDHDMQVDTEVSISADDLDVTELSDAEFEDLKQRLLGLARDRNEQTQKIISEEELEDYLENGWRYVDENSRGIIVER